VPAVAGTAYVQDTMYLASSDKMQIKGLNNSMDEKQLVSDFQKNKNADAYEQIYDAYVDSIFSRCLYILGDKDIAEEATQDTMVKVYYALGRFEGRSSLKTWMYRIATNHCFGVLKKRRELSYEELSEEGAQFENDENIYETLADQSQVTDVLSLLSKDIRAILLLKYVDGYSYQEVAVISQLSPSAVKMRIHRAKQEITALKNQGRI